MLTILASSLAGIITFALFDYVFLAHIAKDFYLRALTNHVTIEKGSLVPYLPAVPFVYIVAIIALYVFVISRVSTLSSAILFGGVLGFCMYALYDFTNLATLKDYTWSITIVDIIWGTFLVATVSGVMFYIKSLLA